MQECQACHRPFLPTDGDAYRNGNINVAKLQKVRLMSKLKSYAIRLVSKVPSFVKAPLITIVGLGITTVGLILGTGIILLLFPGIQALGYYTGSYLFGWSFCDATCKGGGDKLTVYVGGWLFGAACIFCCTFLPYLMHLLGKYAVRRGIKGLLQDLKG